MPEVDIDEADDLGSFFFCFPLVGSGATVGLSGYFSWFAFGSLDRLFSYPSLRGALESYLVFEKVNFKVGHSSLGRYPR